MALSMQQEFSRGLPDSKPTPGPRGAALLRNGDEDEVLDFFRPDPFTPFIWPVSFETMV